MTFYRILSFVLVRNAADADIQIFAAKGLSQLLDSLILPQMRQNIGNTQNRILRIFSQNDFLRGSILLYNDAM